jgi:hypothetical protein
VSRRPPRILWRLVDAGVSVECRLNLGCGVVELVVERGGEPLRREAYPDQATAHERARALRTEHERAKGGPE